jgi:hypothetical protein
MRIARIAPPALLAPYRTKPRTAAGFLAPTTGRRGEADGLASAPPSGAAVGRRLKCIHMANEMTTCRIKHSLRGFLALVTVLLYVRT